MDIVTLGSASQTPQGYSTSQSGDYSELLQHSQTLTIVWARLSVAYSGFCKGHCSAPSSVSAPFLGSSPGLYAHVSRGRKYINGAHIFPTAGLSGFSYLLSSHVHSSHSLILPWGSFPIGVKFRKSEWGGETPPGESSEAW